MRPDVVLEAPAGAAGIRWGRGAERGIQILGSNSAVRGLELIGGAAAYGQQQFAVWMDGDIHDVAVQGNRIARWHVAVAVRTFLGRSPTDFSISGNRVQPMIRWRTARQVQVISMLNHSLLRRIARFRVDGNRLLGAPNGGIFIDGGRSFSISNNRVVSSVGPEIGGSMIGVYTEYGNDTTDGTVANNTIVGSGKEVSGIELNAGLDDVRVTGNRIDDARQGVAYYPGFEGDRYPRSHDVTIARNHVSRPHQAGFFLDGAADRLTLTDNVVLAPRQHGFFLNVHDRATPNAAVVDLTLRGNVVVARWGSRGFWIGDATRVTFEGNTVCHGSDAGAPAVGLEIAPRVSRVAGAGNLLEGRVTPLRDERTGSPLSRRLGGIAYATTAGCPRLAGDA
ncbi:MAG: right-handed parallel beta-helix repeat-containing protein [Actinobacteria bacterium]|nr:right-handed parallel beta-helix repeat-containing protein [Actinomycetota bacterium]